MLFKHIIGELSFKAEGDYTLKFVNAVRKADFLCKNLYIKNNIVYGRIYGINLNKLSSIAHEHNMKLISVKESGLIYKLLPYKKRIGLFAGLLFSAALIFLMSNVVLKIRILGCDALLYQSVYSALEHNGISPGKFIPSMDFNTIEMKILGSVDGISWIGIRSTGGVLTVSVSQATPKPEILTRRLPCNIISTKDAQIVSVQIYMGQLSVLIGDGVKKGDILVNGLVTDENGKTSQYHSYAKITGRYEEKIEFVQPFCEELKIVTEQTSRRKYLNFFSLKIPLFIGKDIEGEYSYTERTNSFSLFTLKIPLGITHSSYSPFEMKSFSYSEDEARIKLEEKIQIYEQNFLSEKEIISKEINETVSSDSIIYSVKYLVEGEIGQVSELLVKN
ncbi:MAG: sporulation protein YqfD [Oscillospiraceae bacterium]|jgi:similar to stage IV sporulation protein